MSEKGHWVTIQGRKVFITDDPVEKRDKEIADRENQVAKLNGSTSFDTSEPLAPGKHNIYAEGGQLRYSVYTEREKPYIYVHGIVVDEDKRNKGIGSKLLSQLIKLADRGGLVIELQPVPIMNNKMSREELRDWYIKRGFERGSWLSDLRYTPK